MNIDLQVCQNCNGSGEAETMDGNGDNTWTITAPCGQCKGAGELKQPASIGQYPSDELIEEKWKEAVAQSGSRRFSIAHFMVRWACDWSAGWQQARIAKLEEEISIQIQGECVCPPMENRDRHYPGCPEYFRVQGAERQRESVRVQRHAANEWADMACNAIQWMKNIIDGTSAAETALGDLECSLRHCQETQRAADAFQPIRVQADENGGFIES